MKAIINKILSVRALVALMLACAASGAWATTLSSSGYISKDSANPTAVFSGVAITDIALGKYVLSGNIGGGNVDTDGEAVAYNYSVVAVDNVNSISSLTVQFQRVDGGYCKCVEVVFTESSGNVINAYAKRAGYKQGAAMGGNAFDWWGTVVTDATSAGYGVYDLSLTLADRKPLAVWDGAKGDFNKTTVNNVTFNSNGNTVPDNGSNVKITGNLGAIFDLGDNYSYVVAEFTVTNLNETASANRVLALLSPSAYASILDSTTTLGVYLDSGTRTTHGIWTSQSWSNSSSSIKSGVSLDSERTFALTTEDSTYIAANDSKIGTHLFELTGDSPNTAIYGGAGNIGLRSNQTYRLLSIGGLAKGSALSAFTDLVITKVVIYASNHRQFTSGSSGIVDVASVENPTTETVANGATISASTLNAEDPVCVYTEAGATINLDASLDSSVYFFGSIAGDNTGLTLGSANDKAVLTDVSHAPFFKGSGAVSFPDKKLPAVTSWMTDSTSWTGTVILNNCGADVAGTSNHGYVNFESYGNANSFIRAPGYKGYTRTNLNCPATLVIESGETFTLTDGNGSTTPYFTKLKGSGTLALAKGRAANTQYVIGDVSKFTGAVTLASDITHSVVIGGASNWSHNTNYNKKLVVAGNATIAAGKTWSAPNGIVVNGTLTLADSTSTLTGTVTGSGKVIGEGSENVPNIESLTQSGWTGTVEVSGAQVPGSVTGSASTRFMNSGSKFKVTSGYVWLTTAGGLTGTVSVDSGAGLIVSDNSTTELSFGLGTVEACINLYNCSALTTLTLDVGTERSITTSKIQLPHSVTLSTVNVKVKEVHGDGGSITFSSTAGLPTVEGRTYSYSVLRADGETVPATMHDGVLTYAPAIGGGSTIYDITFKNNSADVGKSGWKTNTGTFTYTCGDGMLCFDKAAAFNNNAWDDTTGLYLRCTPYIESAASRFNSLADFTTVVVGQMSAAHNTIFIHLGSSNSGGGLVIATTDNDNEVIIAKNSTTTVDFANGVKATVPNAATARHAYVIVKSGSVFNVWVDGVKRGSIDVGDNFELGASSHAGLQVGKQFGGDALGSLNGVSNDDTGVINVIRIFDYAVSEAQAQAIFNAYPYISAGGLYTRTINANANLSATATWVKSGDDTAHDLPVGATVDAVFYNPSATLTVVADATLTVNTDLTLDKLTVGSTSDSEISIASDDTHVVRVSDSAIINSPVSITYGALSLVGTPVQLGSDAALHFDCSALDISGVYATTHYQLTGLVDRNDTRITATLPTAPTGRTVVFGYSNSEDSNGYYELLVTTDHSAGANVYYSGSDWANNFAVVTSETEPTTVFPDDTVVIPVTASDSGSVGATLPTNVTEISLEKSYTFNLSSTTSDSPLTITVPTGMTLKLNGTLKAPEITLTGGGTVECSADNTLQGTIKGNVTITYPNKVTPDVTTENAKAVFTNEAWAGTLVITNCGHLKSDTPRTQVRVPFEEYGSANSKIRAPGFKGIAAVANASTAANATCAATLFIDAGDVVEFNHGWLNEGDSDFYAEDEYAGFKFAKLAGTGRLFLDGTTDYAQYVFGDVSGFAGMVDITYPGEGGRKSYIFGANGVLGSPVPANLVIAANTSATVAGGKTWDIPAGVIIDSGATLNLTNSTITVLSSRSEGTLAVANGASGTVTNIMDSVVTTKLAIGTGSTLNITDTSLGTLTIPADSSVGGTYANAGTLNLSGCTSVTNMYFVLGDSTTVDFGTSDNKKIVLPSGCTTVYLNIGAKRDLTGYTVPSVAGVTFIYYAEETAAEYANGGFEATAVPDGVTMILKRRSGMKVDTGHTGTTRSYNGGRSFAGAACWHEWDFEQDANRLNDTGMYSDEEYDEKEGEQIALSTGDTPVYSTVSAQGRIETFHVISAASNPFAAVPFETTWSAAVRCTMPSTAGQVAVAFGDTTNGILGLASGSEAGVVDLFNWTSTDGYRALAQFKVEKATTDMHIYVFTVTGGTVSLYRDGEFIHSEAFSLAATTDSKMQFMVGDVCGTRDALEGLPDPAEDDAETDSVNEAGYVDYIRLYYTVLPQSDIEGLSRRRPFVSAIDAFERTVGVEDFWDETGKWTWTKANGEGVATAAYPNISGANVTVGSEDVTTLRLNLASDIKYGTLKFTGTDTISLVQAGTGAIGAEMLVVRSGAKLTADYNAVDFSDSTVGVDADAKLTFNLANYPFAGVTATTTITLIGYVPEAGIEAARARYAISVPDTLPAHIASAVASWSGGGSYQVTITPDHTAGTEVYYGGNDISGVMDGNNGSGTVYADAALSNQTKLFPGDTMVISDAWTRQDNTAWISDTFANDIKVRRTTLNLKPGVDSAVLNNRSITVESGKTLNLCKEGTRTFNFGNLTLNGTGNINFVDDATVASLSGTAGIVVDGDATLTLGSIATFVKSVDGTGTVKLPAVAGDIDFNTYGNANSTVEVTDVTAGVLTADGTCNPTLLVSGGVAFISVDSYTFTKVTGSGNMTFPSDSAVTITELVDYTGTIINNSSSSSSAVTVTKLTKTGVYGAGDVLLTKDGTGAVNVSAVEIGGVAKYGYWDGNDFRLAAAEYNGQRYSTLAAAISAAGDANLASIIVYDDSVVPVGYAISGSTVSKAASTFVWNGGESGAWASTANWLVGGAEPARLPASVDTVLLARDASVTVSSDVTAAAISCSSSVTLTKDSSNVTLTATTVELTVLGSSITVNGVTFANSLTPTTPVTNARVKDVTTAGVTTYTVVSTNVAKVGDTEYATLAAAIENAEDGQVITLLNNEATLDLSTTILKELTIDGDGKYTLTFNLLAPNSHVNTAYDSKLVLQNINLTNTRDAGFVQEGDVATTVPNHNISFNCPVELKNVTSAKAMSFYKNATLDTVTVEEASDAYAIWIHTSAYSVSIKDLTVNTTAGRGIKVSDAFLNRVNASPAESTSLSIDGATFTTKNAKAAVLVGAGTPIAITATGTIDISGVPADRENLVWVDEDYSATFGTVSLDTTGAAGISSVIGTEPIGGGYAATLSTGGKINGYYKTLKEAVDDMGERYITPLKEGSWTLKVDQVVKIDNSGTPKITVSAPAGYVLGEEAGTQYTTYKTVGTISDSAATIQTEGMDVVVPAAVTSITVAVTDSAIGTISAANVPVSSVTVKYGETVTTGAYTITKAGNVISFAINTAENAAVTVGTESIKVKPEIRTGADTEPMTLDGDTPGFTVKTIPGLYYSAESCLTPNGTFTRASVPQQATTASTIIETADDMDEATVKYYRIKVGTTPND